MHSRTFAPRRQDVLPVRPNAKIMCNTHAAAAIGNLLKIARMDVTRSRTLVPHRRTVLPTRPNAAATPSWPATITVHGISQEPAKQAAIPPRKLAIQSAPPGKRHAMAMFPSHATQTANGVSAKTVRMDATSAAAHANHPKPALTATTGANQTPHSTASKANGSNPLAATTHASRASIL